MVFMKYFICTREKKNLKWRNSRSVVLVTPALFQDILNQTVSQIHFELRLFQHELDDQ